MLASVDRIIEHAAGMHGVDYTTSLYGKTTTFTADDQLVTAVVDAARSTDAVTTVTDREEFGASEDASYLIERVRANGGQATYLGIGASNPSGHHTSRFDIDEEALQIGVNVVINTIERLSDV